MCIKCLKERLPDRGTTCLEGGSYLLNYSGCAECGRRSLLEEKDSRREEDDEDGEERITFNHVCKECGHVVASHTYTFSYDDEYQEFSMECNLCGHGEATSSVLPDDPREQQLY